MDSGGKDTIEHCAGTAGLVQSWTETVRQTGECEKVET